MAPDQQALLERFDDEHPRAFAENEAIAIKVERSRCVRGMIERARADDAHQFKRAQDAGRDRRIGTAGEHHVGFAGANHQQGVADGVAGAGAAGGDDMRRAAQFQLNGKLAGQIAVRARGDGERRSLTALEDATILFFDKFQPAPTGAERDAEAAAAGDVVIGQVNILLGHRLTAGGDGEGNHPRNAADIGRLHHRERIESLDNPGVS